MITKMKKIILFMSDSAVDMDADLTLLGLLGVMHVAPFQPAKDESIERVDARIKQLEKAISILDRYDIEPFSGSFETTDFSTIKRGEIELMEKVLYTENNRIQLENKKEQEHLDLEWYRKWGNISAKDVADLNKNGVFVKLYLLNERELKNIQEREDIQFVGKLGNLTQVVLISGDINDQLTFQEVRVPQIQFDELELSLTKTIEEHTNIIKDLQQLHAQKGVLQNALDERIRRLNVRNIQYEGMAIDKQVRCWKGFIPDDAVSKFEKAAGKYSWGYIIDDPKPEEMDDVPTLVRTSRWAERIRPVLNFMGLVSGYKELDVSKVFMIFFTFFTGILVGDAGYGFVFLLITFLVHYRQKFVKKIEFELMYTLSVSIMFWGVLTGTYFGAEAIAEIPFLSNLRISELSSFGGDNIFVQKFMFFIGAIHLSIGHLQIAWRYINNVKAIAQLGWVAIIWGLYLLVNQMVLGISAPEFTIWLFVGGALLIALFSNPGTSFIKGVILSIANLPLSIINGFSDIISYIRLYAVGLSTVLMAASFNKMAIGDGISTIASGFSAVIILVLGHSLNMILAAMAVLVHGVRLNMLEYAGHAAVEFSGNEYTPFKLKNNKKLKI